MSDPNWTPQDPQMESDRNQDSIESKTTGKSSAPSVEPTSDNPQPDLLKIGFFFQGALALLGIFLGTEFDIRDRSQSLLDFDWPTVVFPALVYGILGTLPLLAMIYLMHIVRGFPFGQLKQTAREKLYPLFKDYSIASMIFLSLLAGVTEEILFRWCLQGGLAETIAGQYAWLWALLIASFVFGLVHCVNLSYILLVFVIGIWLGWLMILSGTYLAPTIAHTLYDFAAIYYIARVMDPAEVTHQT